VAINKSKSPTWVKVVLVFLIIAFIAMFIPAASGLFSGASKQSQAQSGVDQVQQINSQYQPQIDSLAAVVQSQPTSFTALVNLGNTYMDWGGAILQASQTATAPAMQFLGARNAYEQALKIKKDDPTVYGDYAVVLYYTGDATAAIAAGERAVALDPKLTVMWFNLGNFYLAQAKTGVAGTKAKAIAAYNRYLQLDPSGDRASAAKSNITEAQNLP
jgi:tetratricopeptide (TPR) repeat protein